MAADWFNYQEEAAAFFRGLGLDAQTNVTVQGVRTQHDIDVLVKMHHVGFDVTWVIECKHWKSKVSKLHVAGLRTIVQEIGADRGILLCEAGFQSGAIEAAQLHKYCSDLLSERHAISSKRRVQPAYSRIVGAY